MDEHVGPGAFFHPNEQGLMPVAEAASPWAKDMLHGRLLSGLAARAVEQEFPDPAFRLARLTVDLFRAPPMEPVVVTARLVRNGRRVRTVDILMSSGPGEVARAHGLLLQTGPHPDVTLWRPAEWNVPSPDQLAPPERIELMAGWDIRPISSSGFFSAERKQVWTRDTWPLVAGEALSPLVRAALAADLPNPLTNAGPEGLPFINADLTLSIRRPPVSEWIGLEVAQQLGQDGIAIGSCMMYDTAGAIGWSSVCALASQQSLLFPGD